MALTATIYRVQVALSDVDRGVYEALDLRVARHPSETLRYLVTRTLAYCLAYEDGIAWSKGGISSTDEPPIAVRDATGALRAWIEVGAPSADRLHKASKAADRVLVFTCADLRALRREAGAREVHRADAIEVWWIEPAFVEALEARFDRHTEIDLTRHDGHLYATVAGDALQGAVTCTSLRDVLEEGASGTRKTED
jgi:uncharacterized protein YaeQ